MAGSDNDEVKKLLTIYADFLDYLHSFSETSLPQIDNRLQKFIRDGLFSRHKPRGSLAHDFNRGTVHESEIG